MAKFRQYSNGIFGHRYRKKYYILRNNNNKYKTGKLYSVIDEEQNVLLQDEPNYDDCEWYIDKLAADEQEMEIYQYLYGLNISSLHALAAKYSAETEAGTIDAAEKKAYPFVLKILDRKIREVPF